MFVHLHVHSPYSFLDGASEIEALVRKAASLGMPALALTDHDNLCAAVKFTSLCRAYGVRPILGSEVTMSDGSHLTFLAQNRTGYANLCRLLTVAHAGERLNPLLPWPLLESHAEGLICLSGCRKGLICQLILERQHAAAMDIAENLRDWFGGRFTIELQEDLAPYADMLSRELAQLGRHLGVAMVATNNVHYAERDGFAAHDILRCVKASVTVGEVHPLRPFNNERYLKSAAEMMERFAWCPEAMANTLRIADQCEDVLPRDEEITPAYLVPEGRGEAADYLRSLAYKGATHRYRGMPPRVQERLDFELKIICELGYADYFLMVWEIVRWARKEGIRATGRGSAADSCVAYALTLTDVDVIARNLPFARFLVPGKKPDIDCDFPSTRRDDVFRYIVGKYGEANTGMVCTFHTFWARSAVRDIGKALGLPPDALEVLSKNLSHFVQANKIEDAFGRLPELREHGHLLERFKLLFSLCGRISGFPRHLGTHSSGIVISRRPLAEIAPLQPSARGITQIWTLDKDDAEEVGAIKFDVLSLRMLSAVSDAEEDIGRAQPAFRYDRIPMDDEETYRMFRAGAAVGTFQFESAAQLSLAVTLHPDHFEDLVASVALIRPGPVRGNVVQRFVACRNGWMRADLIHPCLATALNPTYGVIVFQEQVNDVVAAMTGCTDADADKFRKSLTKHTKLETLDKAREEFVMKAHAYRPEVDIEALHVLFNQIEGWGGYGFTHGHAASFALTGYRTAYLSVHHAAEFFAGIMNNQPMGYYTNNSIAGEARRRGVTILPLDINASGDKCVAEGEESIRLGLRLVTELREEDVAAIVEARTERSYVSLLDFCARVPMHRDRLENLILAGGFDRLDEDHAHRRGLLWRLEETLSLAATLRSQTGGEQTALSLGSAASLPTPIAVDIEPFSAWDCFLWEWRTIGVTAGAHVFAWLREHLARKGVMTAYEAARQKPNTRVVVAGINIRPHRPPTRSGRPVLFCSVEDETGILQGICLDDAITNYTPVFLSSLVVMVQGTIQRKGSGATLIVEKAKPLRMQQFLNSREDAARRLIATAPPPSRTYVGTQLTTV
jgi:error-prone DNA polymerase